MRSVPCILRVPVSFKTASFPCLSFGRKSSTSRNESFLRLEPALLELLEDELVALTHSFQDSETANAPGEDTTAGTSPSSDDEGAAPATSNTSGSTPATVSGEQESQQQQYKDSQEHHRHQQHYQHQLRTSGSTRATTPPIVEDGGAPCEMRRTPPQNKVDRSGSGQSGSSPRVTLRLNQVRSARDEKKGTGSRQVSSHTPGPMDGSSKTSSGPAAPPASGPASCGGASADGGDVYEFKSSKEATPVRGASSSPVPEKDREGSKAQSGGGGQGGGGGATGGGTAATPAASSDAATPSSGADDAAVAASPSCGKRAFEGDPVDEQDEENRRKKRKDSEGTKEGPKGAAGRQTTGRSGAGAGEKCTKSGKQGSGAVSGKSGQSQGISSTDRKSPSSSAACGSSPKPVNPSGSTNSKTATPGPPESDGEDDRSKSSSDSSSAPKVPPLKIVIPQSTVSEQEQGCRNGKSTSNRGHQLPYVVASSNSNDSTDKDQSQTASGTTSPVDGATTSKAEDKKDFSGALPGEERFLHYQRVLRSSHRTSNGSNGSSNQKETTGGSAGNASYSNSSPIPATSSTDRSNNSSPQQQRHHSPTPETTTTESSKVATSESTSGTAKTTSAAEKSEKNADSTGKGPKDGTSEASESTTSTTSATSGGPPAPTPAVELHPRKRKMKPNKEAQQAATANVEANENSSTGPEVHPHDQPITNCYQLFLNIRKQIERRRKGLFPVQPKPPQGFKDYLMNRCTYVLASNAKKEPNVSPPAGLPNPMKDLYVEQEKERYRLRMQHVVEKEKLVLSVEQEILRVHGRAARALANQSLPFSVCTILKDEEVYNVITPEQEEKDRNARSRYNGRLFLSWLQDVDDKWEKIKEAMLLRHHNEAESLHAVQRMDWEWKLKEVGLCEFKSRPQIDVLHVPMVHVSDDFDLLPA
ncbi:mucin-19 isoform X2 [Orussus abietinus]|uniref:mucin-19 isoform X2 n=1 Tax=Orussus abietinus TaxID=222816 RepID=UPI0006251F57|nr:mucin-19 isoform X2 [Orussus abietinus]